MQTAKIETTLPQVQLAPGEPLIARPRASYEGAKRILDIVMASILLVLSSPIMLIIAMAVAIESPGPVIFRQERVGKNGKPFSILKFRSMSNSSDSTPHLEHVRRLIQGNTIPEELGAETLKLKGDSRVTKVGKIIRGLSLDELPQLLNVIRGEMSIVGPRPALPYEYELYSDWHKQRALALPGITGLWQVTARNQVSFDQMVTIDITYINTMSLGLDLSIMARTPLEMLRGKGGG